MRTARSDGYVVDLRELDRTQVALGGGKGANLGELSRIDGVVVPAGFCVTTEAFGRIMAEAPSVDDLLGRLSGLDPDDREAIRTLGAGDPAHHRGGHHPRGGGGGGDGRRRPAR